MDYLIVDVETTGLADDDEPIECAALRVTPTWGIAKVFYRRWRPTMTVKPEAAAVNGYTPEAWDGYGWACAADLLALNEFAEGAKLAGSNPAFDARMLSRLRTRLGVPEPTLGTHRMTDLGSLGEPLCRAVDSPKGGQAAILAALERVGLPVPPVPAGLAQVATDRCGAHTAIGDAWAALWAIRQLMEPAVAHWQAKVTA